MDLIPSSPVAKKIGRIAQLEERCPYKAEVTGSIPVPPTSLSYGMEKQGCCLEGGHTLSVKALIDDHEGALSF